jgi:Heavy metal associated domain 2
MAAVVERPHARLVHATRGRARVRVDRAHRSPEQMEHVRRQLAAQPGVHEVEVNRATGSVVVRGHHRDELVAALSGTLTLVGSLKGDEPEQGVDVLVGAVRAANQRLTRATGGRLSLRWLVPAVFVSLGVRELMRQGLTVGTIPWYVLLYYGIDSFLKLYPEHAPRHPQHPAPPAPPA